MNKVQSFFLDFKKMSKKVIPGERLASTNDHNPGPNTYVSNSCIYSSIVGHTEITNAADNKSILSVLPTKKIVLPTVGGLTVIQVSRVKTNKIEGIIILTAENGENERLQKIPVANLHSIYTGSDPLTNQSLLNLGFSKGSIRKEDIRQTDIDNVDCFASYQPGDFVLARVIGLGDHREYILSTAENNLGVIWSRCEASGNVMVPKSWTEVICPETGIVEKRKVANIG